MHSLSYFNDAPDEYKFGMQNWQPGDEDIVLSTPPSAVNVRVGQSKEEASYVPPGVDRRLAKRRGLIGRHVFHGVPLDDLSDLIDSCVAGEQVVPVLMSSEREQATLQSLYSAMCSLPQSLELRVHQYLPAFAMTDFKLQGRTLPKLILNICERPVQPYLDWCSFYVMVSRVCERNGLRLLYRDPSAIEKIGKFKMDAHLKAWEGGYKTQANGLGVWDKASAAKRLKEVYETRAAEDKKTSKAKTEAKKTSTPAGATKRTTTSSESARNVRQKTSTPGSTTEGDGKLKRSSISVSKTQLHVARGFTSLPRAQEDISDPKRLREGGSR
jgi:hypothetical protein